MKKEKTACTGLKCPLKYYCENFRNHEQKPTLWLILKKKKECVKIINNYK